jgi:hypothetical protein
VKARLLRLLLGQPLGIWVRSYPACECGCTEASVELGLHHSRGTIWSDEFSLGRFEELREHLGNAIMAASDPS